jgi:hypothetical protein
LIFRFGICKPVDVNEASALINEYLERQSLNDVDVFVSGPADKVCKYLDCIHLNIEDIIIVYSKIYKDKQRMTLMIYRNKST